MALCGVWKKTFKAIAVMTQAAAQDWISEIPLGLIQIPYRVALGHRAPAQASKLGKDEPHPVGPLVPLCEFLDNLFVHRRLSIHEADEIRVGHARAGADT